MCGRPVGRSLIGMDVAVFVLIVAAAVVVAVAAMLVVRRRAPDGSFFSDGDRASGVFGVLATESKTGAESEALAVVQQFETAQFLEAGSERGAVSPWGLALFRTMRAVQPTTDTEQSAHDKWFDLTSTREEARRDRVHASEGVIPLPLWRILFFIAAIILVYMLFFADSGERAVVQGMLMGSVVAVIVATLLLIRILDTPYRQGPGQLHPVAME
jgi:hypothetical protein